MDIGTGIAIAGVWIFAGLMGLSKNVTGIGLIVALICAGVVTGQLI